MIKQIMIPVAAFAITATGASAFTSDRLTEIDLDLTSAQVEALEEAHELRVAGAERESVRAVLDEAGFDRESLRAVRSQVREYRQTVRAEIKAAVAAEDYEAFLAAAAGTKLADAVDSESDFERLVEAQALREAGDKEGAKAIMTELGIEKPEHRQGHRGHGERGEG